MYLHNEDNFVIILCIIPVLFFSQIKVVDVERKSSVFFKYVTIWSV